MTKAKAEKIRKSIDNKIRKSTVDMEWWAYFWGFTVGEYEEFLDLATEALEQEPLPCDIPNTTQRNYNFNLDGNITSYKLLFGETPHLTLCHPLIKQTVENMRFENIVASPYMPYDKANNEGELWVMNETSGVVEMKIFGIPKDWSDNE